MSKMAGIVSGGAKKHPGEPSGGMSNAKVTVNIPKESAPGEGMKSGVSRHKNNPNKVETLNGFPKK
jgi:hypothetical protein